MKLYFDLDLKLLVIKPGFGTALTALSFKRGDQETLELQYCRGAVLDELAGGESIRWGVKKDLDTGLVALADTWEKVDELYTAPFNLNTEQLLSALGSDVTMQFLGELTFSDANGGPTSSQTIRVTIENDVNKEEDGTPTSLPSPSDWLSARGVRYDIVQALSDPEKAKALNNLGIGLLVMLTSDKSGVNLIENSDGGVELALWNPDTGEYEPIGAFGADADWKIDKLSAIP